ncbi:hypothetical protein [Bacillus thuringiensis]|uniref:hypothetical protein n=1 Tax=Bacillus thuringiensis TaxID=1428 RepID=UPI0011AA936E|nr:hypothetical protein [Bacillus thuringiensis]
MVGLDVEVVVGWVEVGGEIVVVGWCIVGEGEGVVDCGEVVESVYCGCWVYFDGGVGFEISG